MKLLQSLLFAIPTVFLAHPSSLVSSFVVPTASLSRYSPFFRMPSTMPSSSSHHHDILTLEPAATSFSVGPKHLRNLLQHASRQQQRDDLGLDLRGIVWLEHLNLVVGSMDTAKKFYLDFLGLTVDQGNAKHFNLGQQQVCISALWMSILSFFLVGMCMECLDAVLGCKLYHRCMSHAFPCSSEIPYLQSSIRLSQFTVFALFPYLVPSSCYKWSTPTSYRKHLSDSTQLGEYSTASTSRKKWFERYALFDSRIRQPWYRFWRKTWG